MNKLHNRQEKEEENWRFGPFFPASLYYTQRIEEKGLEAKYGLENVTCLLRTYSLSRKTVNTLI